MTLSAVPLTSEILPLLNKFDCEYLVVLADYLRDTTQAMEDGRTGETKTTIILDDDSDRIVAYFSIKCSSLRVEEQNDDVIDIHIYPTVEVVMFAVDLGHRGCGIGEKVFGFIINHIANLRTNWYSCNNVILGS